MFLVMIAYRHFSTQKAYKETMDQAIYNALFVIIVTARTAGGVASLERQLVKS